ncbi:MAG: polymer-forming cytoskeletal protein [Proteobacteria bacterium]|nr:MAG: polymer-forming cytoskeletal protein [Pseudomonadota bacterium]
MLKMESIPGRRLETEVSLLSQGSLIKGEFTFDRMTRLHGRVEGKVIGLPGSVLIIGETASVHGEITADEVIIDGFVHGDVSATTKITVSECGRLIGNVKSPKFEVKFGAHFEGRAATAPSPGAATAAATA